MPFLDIFKALGIWIWVQKFTNWVRSKVKIEVRFSFLPIPHNRVVMAIFRSFLYQILAFLSSHKTWICWINSYSLGWTILMKSFKNVICKMLGNFHFGRFWAKKNCPKIGKTFQKMCKFFLLKIDQNNFFIMQYGLGEQTLWSKFFSFMCQKMKLMKQIHLFKKGFVISLKGATFSDFFETGLSNYKPLAIRIRFPLFWGIFFSIRSYRSNLIK